jgi:ribonuclease R
MKNLLLKISKGLDKTKLTLKELEYLEKLEKHNIVNTNDGILSINSKYRLGRLDVTQKSNYLVSYESSSKDLLIEDKDLNSAKNGDIVVCKRIFSKSKIPLGKVVLIAEKSHPKSVVYLKDIDGVLVPLHIKNELPTTLKHSKEELKEYGEGAVLKIDDTLSKVEEHLGHIDDAKVDEKISLTLYNKKEEFAKESEEEAVRYGKVVYKDDYPDREDMTHLSFCTIDPPTAKDHDDAIYYDVESSTLYVAIADVSHYVSPDSSLDDDAKNRCFSIYFPHKSIPMLPRSLSENICSLRPYEDRLAFMFEMKIDTENLEVVDTKLKEVVINSQKRYSYDRVDKFIDGDFRNTDETDDNILKWLMPLYELTKKIRAKRFKTGYDFRNEEIRIHLNHSLSMVSTSVEKETPSHSLIEECMLLANKQSAKMVGDVGVFRIHEKPSIDKIEELLNNLASLGIFAKQGSDVRETILVIQEEANKLGIQELVDKLIIKAQKQASYSSTNTGHFGLGFSEYCHFTSPIRRYSDLIHHRMLKAILKDNKKELDFLQTNIEPICVKLSDLEREVTRVAWDYDDRKYARWAKENINKTFTAIVTDVSTNNIRATITDHISGAKVILLDGSVELFDTIEVEIVEANIATTKVLAKVVKVIESAY